MPACAIDSPGDVAELLASLDASAEADFSRLPSPWHEAVARGVREFVGASREEQARIRGALTRDRVWALVGWARAMATLAVRARSRELAVLGLVGLSLWREVDERDVLVIVPLLRRAAELIGEDARAVLDDAAELADQAGALWLRELRNSVITPAEMGFSEYGEGESFEFRRTEPKWDPEVVLKDVLDPDHFD
jgi:hypothetical protein